MEIGVTVGGSLDRVDRVGTEFDFVELSIGEGELDTAAHEPEAVRERVGDGELLVHLPFQQVLATASPEINEAIVAYYDRLLTWAGRAGARKATLHATSRDPHDVPQRDVVRSQLRAIRESAERNGVELVFENVDHVSHGLPTSVLGDVARDTDTSVCFDVGHAYLAEDHDGMERFLGHHGERVTHLHVHDVRRRGDTHLPLGAGEIEFERVVDALPDFDGTVAIEVFTDDVWILHDTAKRVANAFDEEFLTIG
ncbi:MAG: sugar phosphate isomerase/epimerase family protein [Halopenitus sp.]